MSNKVYEIITEKILNALEKGVVPWHRPWKGASFPTNVVTKKAYRGINIFVLWVMGQEMNYTSGYWLTFNQCRKLGGKVKKGEKSTPVVFWKFLDKDIEDPNTGETKTKRIPLLRYYSVFNVDQCELPEKVMEKLLGKNDNNPIEACEAICEAYEIETKHSGNKAFYSSKEDYINMPEMNRFDNSEAYYSTRFHEMVHSTGHKSRLNRDTMNEMGKEAYSKEELVAEMGAAYLAAETGIENQTLENSAAYINNWMQKIQNDPRLVVSAAGQAQKAVDFILGKTYQSDADE